MANTINYAQEFKDVLDQKYAVGSKSDGLSTGNIRFINANTINVPTVTTGGYKDHSRNGGFNRQSVTNTFKAYTLMHDRDAELFVDTMDVDESNLTVSAANITNNFITEHAIPERDCYRFSKLFAEFKALGGAPDTAALTEANVLTWFDKAMEKMDEASVPEDGRILYLTPAVNAILKNAQSIQRTINVSGDSGAINRNVYRLDNVALVVVSSGRLKSLYDFTNGCIVDPTAKQINTILVHPSAVIATDKHSYIKLWAPGTHTQGDGYLYQNRNYGDLFVLKNKLDGIVINSEA